MRLTLTLTALSFLCGHAAAEVHDLTYATGLVTPSFRGDANTTWVGWDTFDDIDPEPLDDFELIDDSTPDLGTGAGRLWTTNGEDHLSSSGNYYSGFGSVSENITFDVDGVDGSGFTTVIVQARTLFDGFSVDLEFGPIDGVLPTQVLQADNAINGANLFAKYELPGTDGSKTVSVTSATAPFGTHVSLDRFVVDTLWSATGFAPDVAIATPEPTAALLAALAGVAATASRRR